MYIILCQNGAQTRKFELWAGCFAYSLKILDVGYRAYCIEEKLLLSLLSCIIPVLSLGVTWFTVLSSISLDPFRILYYKEGYPKHRVVCPICIRSNACRMGFTIVFATWHLYFLCSHQQLSLEVGGRHRVLNPGYGQSKISANLTISYLLVLQYTPLSCEW